MATEKSLRTINDWAEKLCTWPTRKIQRGLNVATHMVEGVIRSYFKCYLPASGRGESKLATPIIRTNKNAELSATSAFSPLFNISGMNCGVLSQATYWPYQLHCASLQAGYQTSPRVAREVEPIAT